MYARLGSKCPYGTSNTYQQFLTLDQVSKGKGNINTSNKIYNDNNISYIQDDNNLKTYIESPFKKTIAVTEQTKLDQAPVAKFGR